MALTINRKDEITSSELDFIKQKFEQHTNSRAIYACIKYVVYQTPEFEEEIKRLKEKLKESKKNNNKLIKTIRKKDELDIAFKELVSKNLTNN